MFRAFIVCCTAFLCQLLAAGASAQDLIIRNAMVIDSANGSVRAADIVVRDGRIESITAGAQAAGLEEIDAAGLHALPGYIDGHRHIMPDDEGQWFREQAEDRMREYLEAGFTTLMSGGGPVPGILELKRRIEAGEITGPRILTSGRVDPENFPDPQDARAEVRRLAGLGVEIIKARLEEGGESVLAAVTDEARRQGLDVMVHAVTVPLMIAAVEAGAAKLVHTPTRGAVEETEGARLVREAEVEMTSTLGIWVPIYGEDNDPQWRDGTPFPDVGIARAGQGPVNARHLWNAGVTYAFGTDTSFLPRDSLAHELLPLRLLFSPRDILRIMGPNSAAFVNMEGELGLLEAGRLADIVLVEGDPLEDVTRLLNVKMVLKGGVPLVDRR